MENKISNKGKYMCYMAHKTRKKSRKVYTRAREDGNSVDLD